MIFCRDMLWSNANVAPECLNLWNPKPAGGMLRDWRIDLRALRMCVSMTGGYGGVMVANKGSERERVLEAKRALRALTGH